VRRGGLGGLSSLPRFYSISLESSDENPGRSHVGRLGARFCSGDYYYMKESSMPFCGCPHLAHVHVHVRATAQGQGQFKQRAVPISFQNVNICVRYEVGAARLYSTGTRQLILSFGVNAIPSSLSHTICSSSNPPGDCFGGTRVSHRSVLLQESRSLLEKYCLLRSSTLRTVS
jgi:hypothetical protein